MSPDKKQTLKLLKVDNWSVFLLQRLQLMFAKGDCCDLTLKFSDHQELKVHKIVLTTCTKYFEAAALYSVIKMPETLTYTSMLPIINFMYSGKLEFKPELQDSLLTAARFLNMAILVQLLVAQKTPTEAKLTMVSKEELKKTPAKLNQIPEPGQCSSPLSRLAEKKLPFWRKRVYPLMKLPTRVEPEDPRPTRFELPSEETSSLMLNVPSFSEISYESEPVVPSPSDFTLPKEKSDGPIKRRVAPPISCAKAQKLTESQIISGNWSDEDDDAHFESIHTFEDSDDDQPIPEKIISSTPKPILKPCADPVPTSSAKKVRFCLTKEDKENSEKNVSEKSDTTPEKPKTVSVPQQPKSAKPVETPEPKTEIKVKAKEENASVPNHAKIIAEVLKKFPDLVKNNKNIKLKISTPSAGMSPIIVDGGKPLNHPPKSSYVVVKPNAVKSEPSQSVVQSQPVVSSEAESSTGPPWICKGCTVDNRNLMFETYFLYKRHLIDVHSEKVDPKTCEVCGYKVDKKNLRLYHMLTKHNIQPPKNVVFPKCTLCKFVALNESMLAKHYSSHQIANRELVCNICKVSFKSACTFQAHCVTCKPNAEVRTYMCPRCSRVFRTNVSMKAHLKDCRIVPPQETSTQIMNRNLESVEMIQVPIMDSMSQGQKEHSLVQLPTGIIVTDTPNMALLHSDANGLSNVTSGIPNIGFTVLPEDHQTVILLDENSEFFLQGNNPVVVTSDNDEYVVPELLQENMAQLYSTSNISYTVNGTSVISYPVVHMPQGGSLASHPNNTVSSITVGQDNDLFVSSKEITISDDLPDIKPQVEDTKHNILIKSESDNENVPLILPDNGMSHQDNVSPTTCIMRIDNNIGMVQDNSVCLVDSNTPISIMESDGTITDTTPVTIVDTDTPVSVVGTDNTVRLIKNEILENKPTVISVAPEPDKTSIVPSHQSNKIDQISTEWDFDAEEDDSEIVDDPDSRPSRPSIDLQEIS